MAELIAEPERGSALVALGKAVPVAGPLVDGGVAIANKDWLEVGLDAVDLVGDTAAMLTDPIAALASSCAGFLLDRLSPLHEALQSITGSPEQVRADAATWKNISKEIESIGESFKETSGELSEWTGPAADAFRELCEGFGELTEKTAKAAEGSAQGLEAAAVVVDLVYQVVRGIISDLVGAIISAVAEALATLGFGIPAVAAQVSAKVAKWVPKVMNLIEKLKTSMKNLAKAFKELNEIHTLFKVNVSATVTEVTEFAGRDFVAVLIRSTTAAAEREVATTTYTELAKIGLENAHDLTHSE